jgi:hypothetical protein
MILKGIVLWFYIGSYSSESHDHSSRENKGLRMWGVSKEVQNGKDFGEFQSS